MMQIVIDTNNCPFRTLENECELLAASCFEDAVYNLCPLTIYGTVLPKGHGRLIDADQIQFENTWFNFYEDYSLAHDAIDCTPTIVEADKDGGR